jgi:SNF family Na+-dependent transporter
VLDRITEWFLAVGALLIALFVGWKMKDPAHEMLDGASGFFRKLVPAMLFFVRFVMPPVIAYVVYYSGKGMIDTIRQTYGF